MLVGCLAQKARGAKTKIVALEPDTSPFLTTGKGGPHRVEGIAAGFRPPHLKDGEYDEVRAVDEQVKTTLFLFPSICPDWVPSWRLCGSGHVNLGRIFLELLDQAFREKNSARVGVSLSAFS